MIRFRLIGIPVHIHRSFWVAMLVWGVGITLGDPHPLCILYFALAAFICLLVHECGHALTGRSVVRGEVGVCLSWLGSTCCSESSPECSLRQGVLITLAGPLVGLLPALGVLCWLAAEAPGAESSVSMAWQMLQGQVPPELAGSAPELLLIFCMYLLQVSVLWSVLNMLPIYPLDGGLMLHELLGDTHLAHSISLGAASVVALLFIILGAWAPALLMLILSYYNYKCILVHTE